MSLIDGCTFEESSYAEGDYEWSAESLYDAANDQSCFAYNFPLHYFNMNINRFSGVNNVMDMAQHVKRCLDCDVSIPIIISPEGDVVDGYHRVVYALATGESSVLARRLKVMPEADGGNYERK